MKTLSYTLKVYKINICELKNKFKNLKTHYTIISHQIGALNVYITSSH